MNALFTGCPAGCARRREARRRASTLGRAPLRGSGPSKSSLVHFSLGLPVFLDHVETLSVLEMSEVHWLPWAVVTNHHSLHSLFHSSGGGCQGVGGAELPPRLQGRRLDPRLIQPPRSPRGLLACGHLPPIAASIFTWPPPCVSICRFSPAYKDTRHWIRVHPDPV